MIYIIGLGPNDSSNIKENIKNFINKPFYINLVHLLKSGHLKIK